MARILTHLLKVPDTRFWGRKFRRASSTTAAATTPESTRSSGVGWPPWRRAEKFCLHRGVLDIVGAAEDDPPDPLFYQGRGRMVVPEMLEGHLDEPLVALCPQGVAAVAQGGAQHRSHRGPSVLHSLHVHRLLHQGGYPATRHSDE